MHASHRRLLAPRLAAAAVALLSLGDARVALAENTAQVTGFIAKRPLPDDAARTPLTPDRSVKRNAFGFVAGVEDRPPSGRTGLILKIDLGVEHVADCQPAFDCAWPSRDGPRTRLGAGGVTFPEAIADSRFEFGAAGRLGWDFQWFAAELGATAHSTSIEIVSSSVSRTTTTETQSHLRPNVLARLGPDKSWIGGGYGVSSPTTVFYPGFFVRGALRFADRWRATLGFAEATQASYQHLRSDLDLAVRITRSFSLGQGFTMMFARLEHLRVMGELRLFATWHLQD